MFVLATSRKQTKGTICPLGVISSLRILQVEYVGLNMNEHLEVNGIQRKITKEQLLHYK